MYLPGTIPSPLQVFHLLLCRSVWLLPLRLQSPQYVKLAFGQLTPAYLQGLLLAMPDATLLQRHLFDIARVAALLQRAAGLRTMPSVKETKRLLPAAALLVRGVRPTQWVNMVQDSWAEVQHKTTTEAKAAVLETLHQWPLFGSAFFVVGGAIEAGAPSDLLLAVNRRGLHLLHPVTHESLATHPFSAVLSARRVRSEEGVQLLEVRHGPADRSAVIQLRTERAAEAARLIRRYSALQRRLSESDNRRRQLSR
ncbi:unconventional myosin-XV-like [Pollicipes pollicipes]|uniref:unconventional myosin-XV-like n=1 Tax=Pollicipes pollicipes TaxID=41117 RepID=UPI00188595EA|nr:unconventional myosin-XV-like [Pollicipes pollicipes]